MSHKFISYQGQRYAALPSAAETDASTRIRRAAKLMVQVLLQNAEQGKPTYKQDLDAVVKSYMGQDAFSLEDISQAFALLRWQENVILPQVIKNVGEQVVEELPIDVDKARALLAQYGQDYFLGDYSTELKFSDDPRHNPRSPEFNYDEPPMPKTNIIEKQDWLGDDLPPRRGAIAYLGAVYVPVFDLDGEPVAPPVPEGGYIVSATVEHRNDYADAEDQPDNTDSLYQEQKVVMSLDEALQEFPRYLAWNSYYGVAHEHLFESDTKETRTYYKSGDYEEYKFWLKRVDGHELTAAEIGYLEAILGNRVSGKAPVVK